MVALYTLTHLVHFPYTVSVIPLYNDAIYHSQVMCPTTCINQISNGLTEKIVDELELIFFLQTSLLGKYRNFHVGVK